MTKKRSLAEAQEWVIENYGTLSKFAIEHQFSYAGVQRVLLGLSKCLYGEGLAIAKVLNIDLDEVRK